MLLEWYHLDLWTTLELDILAENNMMMLPEGGNDENVTIDQIGETVEIEDEEDDEIEIVLDFIDLTYANNNPQVQYHPAPPSTPPPQCPCRSPPGPLATSTPNSKKRKFE